MCMRKEGGRRNEQRRQKNENDQAQIYFTRWFVEQKQQVRNDVKQTSINNKSYCITKHDKNQAAK